jgi:hypothetical protein
MSRAMSAEVKQHTGAPHADFTFDDLLASNAAQGPVIAAPTVHYMSGGGLVRRCRLTLSNPR